MRVNNSSISGFKRILLAYTFQADGGVIVSGRLQFFAATLEAGGKECDRMGCDITACKGVSLPHSRQIRHQARRVVPVAKGVITRVHFKAARVP